MRRISFLPILTIALGAALARGFALLLAAIFPWVLGLVYALCHDVAGDGAPYTLLEGFSTVVMLILGMLMAFAVGAIVRWQWPLLIGLLQAVILSFWLQPLANPADLKRALWLIILLVFLPLAWGVGGRLGNIFRVWSEKRTEEAIHGKASALEPQKLG
jgi:hypothetical protein